MTETIAINIASGPGGTTVPTMGGTVYTASTVTDVEKTYRIRLYGLGDCQSEGSGGEHDGLWWQHSTGERTFGDTIAEGVQVFLAWRQDSGSSFTPMPYQDFNPNHEYIYNGIWGNGQAWQFQFYDPRFYNNGGTLYLEIEEDNLESDNPGQSECHQFGVQGGEIGIGNPIGIRHGEKREEMTDLSLNTPAGRLELVRTYSQYRQGELQFMGLGWNHNHQIMLTQMSGTPNKLVVGLPHGGEAHYTETFPGSNHYDGVAGVGSSVAWNSGSSQYILTASDKSVYVFNSSGNLLSRFWPSGEAWTYSYSSGKLSEIDDGYGRKLVFRYYASGSHTGQLYRVGDHTFDDTDPNDPDGRYVEYGYTLSKTVNNSGSIVNGTASLLTSVTDVRGNSWTYDYYGQDGGETDARQLNFLIARTSPPVDTTGDSSHTPDGTLTLESNSYTLEETELAVNGGMEADSNWTDISGAAPTTNARSTTQVDSGTYARHVVTSAAGQGIEGETWDIARGKIYIVTAKVYPVSGVVKMQVTGGSSFDQLSSGTGSWQLLRAVYNPIANATDRKLQFVASGGAGEFYVDTVSIKEVTITDIHQERGDAALVTDFAFQPDDENVTTETTAGKVTTHRFSNGVYAGPEDPDGNFNYQIQNEHYRPVVQQDANGNQTALTWSDDGRRLTQVSDALHNSTQFAYDSGERLQTTQDAEGRRTIYAYEDTDAPRQPTLVVVTNGDDLAINGDMEADSDWGNVSTPTSNVRIPAAHSGQFTRHVVASAANQGIEGNTWNLEAGVAYTISARVYAVSGVVKMQVTGETAFDKSTASNGFWEILKVSYTPGSNASGKQLQFIASGAAAEFYVDSVSISKAGMELAVNGGMELNSDWTNISGAAPTTNERTVGADEGHYARRVVTSAANQGIQGNTWNLVADRAYLILACVYPVSGTVRMKVDGAPSGAFDQTTGGTGEWETLRAVYVPGSSVAGVRLQFLADGAAAEFYVDSVFILDSTMLLRWQEFDYDSLGRTLTEKVIDPADGTTVQQQVTRAYHTSGDGEGLLHTMTQEDIGGSNDVVTTYTYDSTGRVIKTQQSSNFGSCDISFTVYDDAGNVVATICNYDPGMSADPTDADTAVNLYDEMNPDKNRVTTYEYDTLGRRVKTVVNAGASFALTTLTAYDALNRVIRTISNYVLDAGVTHPYTALRSAFDHGTDENQNLVTDTFYNARGMVRKQVDVLGNVTLFGYDDAGRLVKTIQSASQPSYNNDYSGGSPDPTLGSYTPGSDTDEDIITTQEYDAAGNIIKQVSPLGNLVTSPTNTDKVGYTTLTGYDELNRPIKTVRNASQPGYSMSADPKLANYIINSEPDKDLVESMEYDAVGRVVRTQRLIDRGTGSTFAPISLQTNWLTASASYGGTQLASLLDGNPGTVWSAGFGNNHWIEVNFGVDNETVIARFALTCYDLTYTPQTVELQRYDGTTWQPVETYTGLTWSSEERKLFEVNSAHYQTAQRWRIVASSPANFWFFLEELEMMELITWDTTLYGFDTLGRQIITIHSASDPDYDIAADPDLSAYSFSSDPDQDIVTRTAYDDKSRVLYTEDTLELQTWLGYDGLGRQVKTIVNPVTTDTNGGSTDPRSSSYTPSSDPDKDLITVMTYDANGRVQSTQDVLSRINRTVYDTLGRVVRTITNYVAQGSTDPKNWVWSSTNNRWEYGSSDTTPIDHDSVNNPDVNIQENIIRDTVYDDQGRVSQTFDNRHNTTLYIYDVLGRRIKTIANYVVQGTGPANWVWDATDNCWEDGAGNAISFGSDKDQNRISATTYDLAGRVSRTRDAAGIENRFFYDDLGRRVKAITNYVVQGSSDPADWVWDATDNRWEDGAGNAISLGTDKDQNLISTTTYNKGGQVVTTTDARGTQTVLSYDKAGRRLTVTQAVGSPLASVSYTCYDKAGRVRRSIQNWIDDGTSPDAQTAGEWDFVPEHNGAYNDRNLITEFTYDLASRRIQTSNPLGEVTQTAYFKDGQVQSMTDPENAVSAYRYDALRRRTRVVQGYVANAEDPASWVWDSGDNRWEKSGGTAIAHGTNNDQNIIVDVTYDKAGRVLTQRNPRGYVTSYDYDQLDRRLELTNPLTKNWSTAYTDLSGGKTRVALTDPNGVTTQRDFDRLGRLASVAYGNPSNTPDVQFIYDNAGNRVKMSEYSGAGFTSRIRETTFGYDDVRRLTSAGFDNDGGGSVDETVAYEYDAGGLRTKLTLPGSLDVVYSYDAKGRLVSLTDWDSQPTQLAYDQAGRHIATTRANGLRSRYEHDAAGRLKRLRHTHGFRTLAHFEYEVDKRGNRIQALEALANPTTTTDTTIAYDDKGIVVSGSWSSVSGFKQTAEFSASLKLLFLGDEATLTMGQGPDHGIYDVYIGGSLWQSFDGYAASAGQRDIVVTTDVDSRKLQSEGPHLVEIHNRAEKNPNASGNKLRFKQLVVADRTWTLQTVKYNYDQLSRLLEARYAPGVNAAAADTDLLRRYVYIYDRAGNRLSQSIALNGGSLSATNYTYNGANQLSSGGATYDDNGNLTSDGSNTYTWDRANRLLSMGGASYQYDGLNNRIQQTVGANVTKYLLDLQPGLAVVLSETTGANIVRNVHSPRGIHAHKDAGGAWEWMVQDGLGSVRGVVDNSVVVLESRNYDPYGMEFGATGTNQTNFGFTGEPMDDNELVYLRNRYMSPALGQFVSLDPMEGLNRYAYVNGNPVNYADPLGLCPENPAPWDVFGNVCRSTALRLAETMGLPPENLLWMEYGQLLELGLLNALNNAAQTAEVVYYGAETAPQYEPDYDPYPPIIIVPRNPDIPGVPDYTPLVKPPPGIDWATWIQLLCRILNGGSCQLGQGSYPITDPGTNPAVQPAPNAPQAPQSQYKYDILLGFRNEYGGDLTDFSLLLEAATGRDVYSFLRWNEVGLTPISMENIRPSMFAGEFNSIVINGNRKDNEGSRRGDIHVNLQGLAGGTEVANVVKFVNEFGGEGNVNVAEFVFAWELYRLRSRESLCTNSTHFYADGASTNEKDRTWVRGFCQS